MRPYLPDGTPIPTPAEAKAYLEEEKTQADEAKMRADEAVAQAQAHRIAKLEAELARLREA